MKTKFTVFCVALLICLTAKADLTATVTPGYQFTGTETNLTFDILNQLGTPTVSITGSVGGSNNLAPGSVTGVQLADNVPDGITLTWNGNSPRQLQVVAGSIKTNFFPTNTWLFPLIQTNPASRVQLAFDTSSFNGTNVNGLALNTTMTYYSGAGYLLNSDLMLFTNSTGQPLLGFIRFNSASGSGNTTCAISNATESYLLDISTDDNGNTAGMLKWTSAPGEVDQVYIRAGVSYITNFFRGTRH